jgi:D-arabinose 1-dehydrogenase-like Zn-dependent alcohol dehydrogenase
LLSAADHLQSAEAIRFDLSDTASGETIMDKRIQRRNFLGCAAAGAAGLTILGHSRLARAYSANQKLGVALVGVSGRGSWFVETAPRIGTEVVALCDVNQRRAAEAFKKFPGVPQFQDFRKMLADRDKQIDAVFVATPDNTHAVISAAAMRAGKHVYCEKPLTHDVAEARALREIAKQQGVVTQMGNQGTATEAFRRAVNLTGCVGTLEPRSAGPACLIRSGHRAPGS